MRAKEFISEDNPTITPKSSDMVQKPQGPNGSNDDSEQPSNSTPQGNNPPPVQTAAPTAKDKAIGSIVGNFGKKMIDRNTAMNQLKAQGVSDNEMSGHLDQPQQ